MTHHPDGHRAGPPGLHFCPRCATALRDEPVEHRLLPVCPACGWVAFRDPKVVAVAVLEAGEGRVWLIRRGIEPSVGEWALPGGYVDDDEHPRAAAARECREEISCEVVLERLVAVEHASFPQGGVVVVAYAGRIVSGSPSTGPEALEVARHRADAPPPLAFGTHVEVLRAYAAAPDGRPAATSR